VPEWGEANKPRIDDFLKFLDGELESRPYVAGKEFTVADITALVAVDFMKVSKLAVPDGLANFARWREAVSGRPSAKA
jgi:glutathione S-transferase